MGEAIARWFWLILTLACIVWYMTVVIYVAIRGVSDIKTMLRHLAAGETEVPGQQEGAGDRADPEQS